MKNIQNQAVISVSAERTVRFTLGGLLFEYDPEKNRKNIEKHGVSLEVAARVLTVLSFMTKPTVGMRTAMIR